jgi:sulfatase maturation enzyme AslB (radical SAM superfamily)
MDEFVVHGVPLRPHSEDCNLNCPVCFWWEREREREKLRSLSLSQKFLSEVHFYF